MIRIIYINYEYYKYDIFMNIKKYINYDYLKKENNKLIKNEIKNH